MTVRYLADTSAVIRLRQRGAHRRWLDAAAAGTIAICDPVELEFLRGARGGSARRALRRALQEIYAWVPLPERAWQQALDLQEQFADTSQHLGASAFDLVIAATALHHRLTVLHDDLDYEVISRVTGLPVQRITD